MAEEMREHREFIDQQRRQNTESLRNFPIGANPENSQSLQNRIKVNRSFIPAESKQLDDDLDLEMDFLMEGSDFILRPIHHRLVSVNEYNQTIKNSSAHGSPSDELNATDKYIHPSDHY